MLLWNVFAQVLLPILVMFSCGWLLDRRWKFDLKTLVRLNMYLFVPAFIFHQVVSSSLAAAMALRVVIFTVAVVGSMFLLSLIAARVAGCTRRQTRALQLATMFYNSGNYGIPLMTLAYPSLGPLLQVFVVLTQNVSAFTVGLLLAASAQRPGWRAMLPILRQVSLWAVASALTIRFFHIPVIKWRWLWVPIEYFQSALVGVALLTLGVQLSQSNPRQSFSHLTWALGLRLLGGPLIAWALVPLFGFHGETAAIMILSSAFPTAVNTALIAHEFDGDSQFAAAAVFYSTLVSMITVTVLIAILQLPQIASMF